MGTDFFAFDFEVCCFLHTSEVDFLGFETGLDFTDFESVFDFFEA